MFYKQLFFLHAILYLINCKFIRLINNYEGEEIVINNSEQKIRSFFFLNEEFHAPTENKKYNEIEFFKIKLLLERVLLKNNFPKVFIDIGAYIGLYSFIINKIYSAKQKKIKIYCFEPSKYAYKLLAKNNTSINYSLYNLGIFNINKETIISAPKVYFTKYLTNAALANTKSMKSINEKGGRDPEKIKLIKLLEVMNADDVQNAHIKIDVEGSEFEILDYLDKNNLYPKSLSCEINSHFLYKRFSNLTKIIGKNFIKKYNFFINDDDNHKLYEVNFEEVEKQIVFGKKKNFFKKFFFPKLNVFDIYLFLKK